MNEESHDHDHEHGEHDHQAMIADFRRRFWVSMGLTVPILLLSPLVQAFLGLTGALAFVGDEYVLLALSTGVFLYGGWPFLGGLVSELGERSPGMMTLIALAISVAYGYSAAVVLGLEGKVFFWELATLVDVMLLGHWIEMKSVMGASGALESLVQMMPDRALRLDENGDTEEVPISELQKGDRVRVRPAELEAGRDGLGEIDQVAVEEWRARLQAFGHGHAVHPLQVDVVHRAETAGQFIGQRTGIVDIVMMVGIAREKLIRTLARQHGLHLLHGKLRREQRRDRGPHQVHIRTF